MKLRNKLIPIMSILASTTVVAPIATSCGNKTAASEDVVDITSPYAPSIARADAITEQKTRAEVQDYYMNKVMENPEIIRQDIWYFESKNLPYRINTLEHMYVNLDGEIDYDPQQQNTITDVVANVNISNVEVKRVEAIIKGVKTQFYTLSMSIGYEFSFRATSLSAEPRILLDETFKYQSTYKDVPIYLSADAYKGWYCSIDLLSEGIDEYLKYVPGWNVTYNYSTGYTANISTHGLSQDFSDSYADAGTITRRSQIYALKDAGSTLLYSLKDFYPNFGSYHLSNIALPNVVNDFKFANKVFNIEKEWSLSQADKDEAYFNDVYPFAVSSNLISGLEYATSAKILVSDDGYWDDEYNGWCDEYYGEYWDDIKFILQSPNDTKPNIDKVNNRIGFKNQLLYNDDDDFEAGTTYKTSYRISEGYAFAIVAYDSNGVIFDTTDTPLIVPEGGITFNITFKFVA